MLYTVEVHLVDRDLVASMTDMRTWLDNKRCEPDTFRYTTSGANVVLRVEFKRAEEAASFADAFAGRLLSNGDATGTGATTAIHGLRDLASSG
jgi:hypothetical protein